LCGAATRLRYIDRMTEARAEETRYEVTCPHCRKSFLGRLLDGSAERYRGFKCPHCKLFVPHRRGDAETAS
jgi:DNA-directed RNA polymerase subunit RPC12/RpoP